MNLTFHAIVMRGATDEDVVQVIASDVLQAELALRKHFPDRSFVLSGPVRRDNNLRSLDVEDV
jgi:hypothetical protein